MARKQKNTIEYFPHTVIHGKKMAYIRSKYKNNGYAVWFMLLEQLGKSDYHHIDLSDDVSKMYLSSEFMISEKLLFEIINDLVKLGDFDKEIWETHSVLYNQKFVDNIEDVYTKRSNSCVTRDSLLRLLREKGDLLCDKGDGNG